MSWHTSAILINADMSKDLDSLFETLGIGGAEAGESVSFEDASSPSSEGVAVGFVDGWTVLWGNLALLMIDDDGVAEFAKSADVFQMTLEGASGTAGFTWYAGGRLTRDWMRQEGELLKNRGKKLPEEKDAFATHDDEQAVWQILIALTVPYKKLETISYQLYSLPDRLF